MVILLTRKLILTLFFFPKELHSEKIQKIIFSVEDNIYQDNIYTTIDLDQRIKYLE